MKKSMIMSLCVIVTMALFFWVPEAGAYEKYGPYDVYDSCEGCHGSFTEDPYIPPVDGVWNTEDKNSLHEIHRRTMLDGKKCDICHSGSSRKPVIIGISDGLDGKPETSDIGGMSCLNCHGRKDDSGLVTGAGLRQHHWNAMETGCTDCHDDSDPEIYTPVGEDVLPPLYAYEKDIDPVLATFPNKPSDPCNPDPAYPEDYGGSTNGLDNDGDGEYDGADSDCSPGICTPGAEQSCNTGQQGVCSAGTQTCAANGQEWGACEQTVQSSAEVCDDNKDNDCDGAVDAEDTDCQVCTPDDGNACTIDSCDSVTGEVTNTPIDPNDGDACTEDTCDQNTGISNTPIDPDDGNACTIDTCDSQTGVKHDPVNVDDGDECTTDTCDPQTGINHEEIPGCACTPTGPEVCDGLDNNCDGNIDESCEADVWLNSVKAPTTIRVGKRPVSKRILVFGSADIKAQQAIVVMPMSTESKSESLTVTINPESIKKAVPIEGRPAKFVFKADITCNADAPRENSIEWNATISSQEDRDINNNTATATTTVICR